MASTAETYTSARGRSIHFNKVELVCDPIASRPKKFTDSEEEAWYRIWKDSTPEEAQDVRDQMRSDYNIAHDDLTIDSDNTWIGEGMLPGE